MGFPKSPKRSYVLHVREKKILVNVGTVVTCKETSMNPFCIQCKKEMMCEKNGVVVHWGNGHCFRGDKWKCPTCNREVVVGFGKSYYDEHLKDSTDEVHSMT